MFLFRGWREPGALTYDLVYATHARQKDADASLNKTAVHPRCQKHDLGFVPKTAVLPSISYK